MRLGPRATAFILILLFLLVTFASLGFNGGEGRWYSLIIRERGEGKSPEDILRERGVVDFSSLSDTVVFSDFSRLAPIPLTALPQRLMESDRRFDPYLRKLYALYDAPQGERLFFRSGLSPISLIFLSLSLGGRADLEQLGQPLMPLAGIAFYLLLGFIQLRRYRDNPLMPLVLQILWIPALLHSTGAAVVLIPLILYWQVSLVSGLSRPGKIIPEGAALLLIVLLAIKEGAPALFWIEFPLTLTLGIAYHLFLRPAEPVPVLSVTRGRTIPRRMGRTEHQLFEPVYFGPPPTAWRSSFSETALSLFFSCLLALPLFIPYGTGSSSAPSLPGRGEFLDHLYFQENILYASPWGSRSPVTLEEFSWERETGKILTRERIIARFDSSWIADRVDSYATGYADSLILALPEGLTTLPQIYVFDFDKYMIFAIILLFFLSKLVLSEIKATGKEKKSLQINKRGREVA